MTIKLNRQECLFYQALEKVYRMRWFRRFAARRSVFRSAHRKAICIPISGMIMQRFPSQLYVEHRTPMDRIESFNVKRHPFDLYQSDLLDRNPGESVWRAGGKNAHLFPIESSPEDGFDGPRLMQIVHNG